jgi:tetratricopeptide (TPR) repeat protein
MGRRRRKQARAEREVGREAGPQGELLGADAEQSTAEDDEMEEVLNGRPRELVLFELVEEVVAPAEPPPAPQPSPPRPAAPAVVRETQRLVAAADSGGYDDDLEDADPQAVTPRRIPSQSVSFEEPNNPEAALERLEAARALSPDSVGVLVNLGWTLGLLGRFDEAERELRRAHKLAPDDLAVRAGIGLLSFRRGLYQQADAELRWVCEQDPEHGPAHFYRGEALNRLGRVDQALEVLERAARLQPTNYRAFYLMGILFDRKNLREEAAAMYRKARELQRR